MKQIDTTEKKSGYILPFLILFCLVAAFFALTIGRLMPEKAEYISIAELDGYDLSTQYVRVSNGSMDQYPGRLYMPEDFSSGRVTDEPSSGIPAARYGTARGLLHLTPGITYGITGSTAAYSQKLWIDGELVLTSGKVADNADEFVPGMRYFTIYFTPTEEYTEFVTQYALFNHVAGGFPFTIGEAQVIEQQNRGQYLCDGIFSGALMSMSIFLTGMFLFYRKQRGFLYLALSCISICIHYLIYDHKNIMMLFPNLNWYVGHKLEYTANFCYYGLIMLFAYSMLKTKMPKWLGYPVKGIAGAIGLFYIIAPSYIYTRFNTPLCAVLVLLMVTAYTYLLIDAIRKKAYRSPESVIALFTSLSVIIAAVLSCLNYIPDEVYSQPFVTIMCVFFNSVALILSFSRAERELDAARQKEREVTQTNEMLAKMDALKTDLLHSISHEMKTPLAVMSGYAQLTGWQLAQNAADSGTMENLKTISSEAQRLADMVTKLLNISYEEQGVTRMQRVRVLDVFDAAAAVCRPVLMKNNNTIAISCDNCPDVLANHEMLLQVLINLAINANKHMRDGAVEFIAEESGDGFICFRVSDSGSGVSAQDEAHIFEKGFSRDGSSGLGLSICREVVEAHGGTIALEHTEKRGATIRFTVPCYTGSDSQNSSD